MITYKDINGWFDFEALYDYALRRYPNGHFVEVGAYLGKSVCYLASKAKELGIEPRIDAVDSWDYNVIKTHLSKIYGNTIIDPYVEFMNNCKACGAQDRIRAIQKKSTDAASLYEDKSLDFVFIDAAHDYQNVKQDIESYLPKVKYGGIIGGHDFEPKRSVDGVYRGIEDTIRVDRVKYWPPRTWSFEIPVI